jgi:putative ABC transport system permease protein
VMGIPIVQGEGFTEQDLAGPNGKLMVNQAFVRRYWPGQNAIGRSVTIAKAARWLPDLGQPIAGTVVGVAGDVRQEEKDSDPEVYLPYTWNPWRWTTLQVRARGDVETVRDAVRRALLAVEPDLPMSASSGWLGFRPYEEQLVAGRAARRLTTAAITALSGLSLILAALGLYAVMAYSVTRRRREIGIRLALGSDRRRIVGLVLREGFTVATAGLGLGLLLGWFGASLLRGLVFGIATRDAVTFALVPAVLGLVAFLAVVVPARRAASVPPAEALRS